MIVPFEPIDTVKVRKTKRNNNFGPNAPKIRERCAQTLSKMHIDACSDGLRLA